MVQSSGAAKEGVPGLGTQRAAGALALFTVLTKTSNVSSYVLPLFAVLTMLALLTLLIIMTILTALVHTVYALSRPRVPPSRPAYSI